MSYVYAAIGHFKGTEMAVESLKMSGELTTERYIAIMECQNSAIAAVNAEA